MAKENSDRGESNTEQIIAAYRVAATMITYEGGLGWRVTRVFLSFATILVAGAVSPSFIGSNKPGSLALVGVLVALVGLVATLGWWSMFSRSRKYYEYWVACARELEKKLSPSVDIFSRGRKFAGGDTAKVDGTSIRFGSIERVTMRATLVVVYITYFLTFFVLLALNLWRTVKAF